MHDRKKKKKQSIKSLFRDLKKKGFDFFDTELLPREKSININNCDQIRCVLMKDLDKSKCVRPAQSSQTEMAGLNGLGSYQRNLTSSLKFTSV